MRVLTGDVFCSAYLILQGAVLVDILVQRSPSRSSATFVLEGKDVLAHQEAYVRGQAVGRVQELRNVVTDLRSRLARALREPTSRRPTTVRCSTP